MGQQTSSDSEVVSLRALNGYGELKIKFFLPTEPKSRVIVLLSVGAGGSEEGYGYLGEFLSKRGYFTAIIGHPASDRAQLRHHIRESGFRDGITSLCTDPTVYHSRLADLSQAKAWAQSMYSSDLIVLVGHSLGAHTAVIEAGAENSMGVVGSDGFDGYVAMSPQGPGVIFPSEDCWKNIKKPILLITGTKDNDVGGRSWHTRALAFDGLPEGTNSKWLAVVQGASHFNFAGRGFGVRNAIAATTMLIDGFICGLVGGSREGSGLESCPPAALSHLGIQLRRK